ncbi:hypothetical protein FACS1894214_4920 [Planctomycetales bacterium]|nr:hypothetical protein FACS1894214_4920 [Planctomycetales bacterium]
MFQIDEFFQLDKLQLEAGDKLSLYLEASDKYNLPAKTSGKTEQRIIKGQHWDIEIVTPERLRGLLEVREITFRQRFEVIIGETEKTAALIKEIILEPAEEQIKQANELKPEISAENKDDNKKPSAEEKDNVQQETAQKELAEKILEEKKTAILQTLTAEQAAAGMYNISRSLRDTQKESYDIRTLTEAFRSLRAEMVNNRIFTEEVQKRLDDGIISPMQEVVEKNFAEITERDKSLNETLNIRNQPLRETARKQRAEILEEFAKLLMKLQNIRDKMVSMENYNEAMELLRAIIKQQRHLRQETEEQKKQTSS